MEQQQRQERLFWSLEERERERGKETFSSGATFWNCQFAKGIWGGAMSKGTTSSSAFAADTITKAAATSSAGEKKNSGLAVKPNVPVVIRAKKETDRKLLVAATEGDIAYLEKVRRENCRDDNYGTEILTDTVCTSGCTLLHWAAGSNQVGVLEYLLLPLDDKTGSCIFGDGDSFRAVDLPVTRCKKSLGRTPLHYACRNGCLEAVRWLVEVGGASIGVVAKQGVTPFQLAVWQNRLDICMFLADHAKKTNDPFDPSKDFNDFGCGAVHWIGIAPQARANFQRNSKEEYDDGRDLLPLARWLASIQGMDYGARQRQNHTGLHKASWGGHLALVEYLHDEHDLWDDVVDDAGNYAASLADMAHTPKHAKIATYLRTHCSRKKAESLVMLGFSASLTILPTKEEIRKAYLAKAKKLHPDRLVGESTTDEKARQQKATFDELRRAYLHLTEEDGVGDQSNPAHSLNLMLRYVNNSSDRETTKKTNEEEDFFKARLVAVLLEYGDKGIDLSNVKKKWKQVWPEIPFPSQIQEASEKQQSKKISMAEFLMQKAGDVIRFERYGEKKRRVLVLLKNRNSSKESVLRSVEAMPEVEDVQ